MEALISAAEKDLSPLGRLVQTDIDIIVLAVPYFSARVRDVCNYRTAEKLNSTRKGEGS